MNKNKILKGTKIAIIVIISIIVISLLLHLTMNYLIPFIVNMHNKSGAY